MTKSPVVWYDDANACYRYRSQHVYFMIMLASLIALVHPDEGINTFRV